MSDFASMVRARVESAAGRGHIGAPHRRLDGNDGQEALGHGANVVARLVATNPSCAADKQSDEVLGALKIAAQGSPADARTALTRLQKYLHDLTAADADVAGDEVVQNYRRLLHVVLDH